MRTCIPEGSKALSILASYDGPSEEVGFTVSVYSSAAVSWDKTIPQPPFMHKVTLLPFLKNTLVANVFHTQGNGHFDKQKRRWQLHLSHVHGQSTVSSPDTRRETASCCNWWRGTGRIEGERCSDLPDLTGYSNQYHCRLVTGRTNNGVRKYLDPCLVAHSHTRIALDWRRKKLRRPPGHIAMGSFELINNCQVNLFLRVANIY